MRPSWQRENKTDRLIRVWFCLTVLTAGFCLYRLAVIGEASLHPVFMGFSASRLAMMAVPLICALTGAAGVLDLNGRFSGFVTRASGKAAWKAVLTILFLLFSLCRIIGEFLAEERFLPYFHRLEPLLFLGMILTGSGVLLLCRLSSHSSAVCTEETLIRKTASVCFLAACAVYLLIRKTGIGIIPDEMDWQPVGMTIQYWELWLSLWIALASAVLLHAVRAYRKQTLTTVLLFLAIWIGTAVLWVSIPSMKVLGHSYCMEITAPNELPYPASDSAYYGLWAETVLAGLGFKNNVTTRQFLITVIAFFEFLTKGDILKTIDCMTILLALIPAFIYLLGKKLHSHGAGILAAGLATLREYNTIMLGPRYMVSNAKMFLSDLPALLCMLIILCAAADWFKKPLSLWRILLAGCLTGFSVTVRSQFIILIPFTAICFLLRRDLPFRKRLLPAALFAAAAVLVIAPWLIRSKIITGDFILDEPGIHSTELARRWSDDPDTVITREPGENDAAYAARNQQHMVEFLKEKPLYVFRFIMSHFFNNFLCAVTALPFGTDPGLTVRDVTDTGFHDVEGRLMTVRNIPALMIFLILVTLGMSASRKRSGFTGVFPFYTCLIYLFLTACGRYSGWRFALPADWFFYFYCAAGLAEAGFQLTAVFGNKAKNLLSVSGKDLSRQNAYPAAAISILLVFLALGSVPALSGKLIPRQITMRSNSENIQQLEILLADRPDELAKVRGLFDIPDETVLNGRIIYPRFFYSGEGLASGHPWTAYKIRDFSRLGFVLLNEKNHDVILPLEKVPAFIPNAADIFVIGADDPEGFFRADAIIIAKSNQEASPRALISDIQE